ncbi:MAG: TolC family protein [Ferruginibacter sp.]
MHAKSLLVILTICLSGLTVNAQAKKKWDLRSIVDYAMSNNISVKLSDVQAKIAQINAKQSKSSQIPNLTFSGNAGINSGTNQDPTTFSRVTETYFSSGMQLQSSVEIFNFYSKRNTIAANNWELLAAKANTDKLKNDIALTVANAYLQILLSIEQQNITSVQIQQTAAQLSNTKKLVDAGSLPPLNLTQLEAQLAVDSVNYITAKGAVVQNILTLKAYMNIDPADDFEVETPALTSIPLDQIADLLPENVYALALKNQPLQHYDDLKLKAAQKSKEAARGAMYPTLSMYGSLGTNYQAFKKKGYYDPKDAVLLGYFNTPYIVPGTITDTVQGPVYGNGPLKYLKPSGYTTQLSDNFNQGVGLSLNIPILNGRSLKSNYERSKLNIVSLQLQKVQDDQNLKQNIFQAYNSVLIALEKFNASKKSVDASQLTYDYAKKRSDVGMLGTFDLITSQNNLLRAKLEYTINQFDYVFKMKVLEFYKGMGIKL